MVAGVEIVRLGESQLEPAADVLTRAFFDDPFAVHLVPAEEERDDLLFWYYGTIVHYGLLYGEVYTTAECEGVAVWLPALDEAGASERLQQSGMLDAPEVLGIESFSRCVGVTGHLEYLRKRHMPMRHWYLPVVGVEPSRRGCGIGSALLGPVLARADAEGLPCYLETLRDENLPFYRRHGFGVVVDDVEPSSGLRFWTLRRNPQGEIPARVS